MSGSGSASAEQLQRWNEVMAPRFKRFRRNFVDVAEPHSDGPLARAGLAPGMRVLDVGCGFGETTLQIARHVLPGGSVLGTDFCAPFLEIARGDAHQAALPNATFELVDAGAHFFAPEFDLVFARFGTMFFEHPVAGMRNIGTALAPGGRLLMVVWRALEHNPWLGFAQRIVRGYVPPSPAEPQPGGPGPFSMGDPELVTKILTDAGYYDVRIEQTDASVRIAADLDEAVEFLLTIGPAAEIVRVGGEAAEAKRSAIEADLRAALEPCTRSDGVWLDSSSWAVSAQRA